MKKRLLSMLTIMAVAMTFVFSFAVTGDVYAGSKSKKYYLPKEIQIEDYEFEYESGLTDPTYDKYGNLTSGVIADAIPLKFTIKYKNKKGTISSVKSSDGDYAIKKTYDKKGRLKKIKAGSDTYKYTTNKKGIISKVTRNGKLYYKVKSIKFHKNGFVSKVVYSNGNVNKYNANGLMTYAKIKNGGKYTFKYTKKNGKVVKAVVKKNGKKIRKVTMKYGSAKTKDVWKYSSVMCFAGAPSNACELYSKCSVSGLN